MALCDLLENRVPEKLAASIANVKILFYPEMETAGSSETVFAVIKSNIGLRTYKNMSILVCICCSAVNDAV